MSPSPLVGEGLGRRGRRLQGTPYRFQNGFLLHGPAVVPEPQHAESLQFQPGIPLRIVWRGIHMMTAIQLDNQFLRKTNEIDDEAPQGLLTTKFVARKSFGLKLPPQRLFLRRLLLAQLQGAALGKQRRF